MFPLGHHAPGTAAGGGGGNLTFVGSATSLGASITLPAAVQAGDIGILFDVAQNVGLLNPTTVIPGGWSIVDSAFTGSFSGNFFKLAVSQRIFTGGEGGSSITGMNGGNSNDKGVMVLRKSSGSFTGAAGFVADVSNAASNVDPQTVVVGSAPLAVLGMAWYPGGLALTMSPAATTEINNAARLEMGYIVYNSGALNNLVTNTALLGAVAGLYVF